MSGDFRDQPMESQQGYFGNQAQQAPTKKIWVQVEVPNEQATRSTDFRDQPREDQRDYFVRR